MDFSSFLLLRQEIILLAIILLLLIAEIFIPKNKKSSIVHLAIFLFGIHTVVGFLAINECSTFGGAFQTNSLIHFFKNVLNVGVFILLLQSADWIQEKISLFH
jgi:NADH-quinone oxidoreductase subunit N